MRYIIGIAIASNLVAGYINGFNWLIITNIIILGVVMYDRKKDYG